MKIIINIKTFITMFKQLMSILERKQRLQSTFLLVGVFVCALLETLGVSAVVPFVLILFSPDEMMQNKYIRVIADVFKADSYIKMLIITAILIVIVYLVKNITLLVFQYFQGRFHNEIEKELMTKQYRMFMRRPYEYYLNVNTAEVIRALSSDITQVAQVLDGFTGLISETVTVLMIGVFIIVVDPLISILLIGMAALIALGIVLIFKRRTSVLGGKCREIFFRRSKITLESVGGYKEISIYQKKDYFVDEYAKVNDDACRLNTQYLLIMKIPSRVVETLFITCLLGLACLRIGMGGDNAKFVSLIGALAVASIRILPSISNISGYINTLIYNRKGLESAYNNIEEVKDSKYSDTEYIDYDENKRNAVCKFEDRISLKNISFKYAKSEKLILDNVSLDIKRNESVAFIGESGAGKSTLLDVLLGLLRPQSGGVFMDEHNIEDIPFAWANAVGYVPQNVYLLDDTIRKNIAFGIEEEKINDERIWECLEEASLADFIKSLPGGLDTTVGDRGIRFSGGQRQRVAIARALYHNPQILVLDEATSALDNETEKEVMQAIKELQGKMTIIIVAHRLTTIDGCDRVYKVVDGKVEMK